MVSSSCFLGFMSHSEIHESTVFVVVVSGRTTVSFCTSLLLYGHALRLLKKVADFREGSQLQEGGNR